MADTCSNNKAPHQQRGQSPLDTSADDWIPNAMVPQPKPTLHPLAMEWLHDKRRLPTIFYGTNGDALTDDIIDSIIAALGPI